MDGGGERYLGIRALPITCLGGLDDEQNNCMIPFIYSSASIRPGYLVLAVVFNHSSLYDTRDSGETHRSPNSSSSSPKLDIRSGPDTLQLPIASISCAERPLQLHTVMAPPPKFLLVSLPTSITPSSHKEEALQALQSTVGNDGNTVSFPIPAFKIGTLDALVQQADDLAKLSAACEGVVGKVGESLRGLLEGDEEKIGDQKMVNDSAY